MAFMTGSKVGVAARRRPVDKEGGASLDGRARSEGEETGSEKGTEGGLGGGNARVDAAHAQAAEGNNWMGSWTGLAWESVTWEPGWTGLAWRAGLGWIWAREGTRAVEALR